MRVQWLLCDLVTGNLLTELPLTADGEIRSVIARVDTQQFNLAVLDDKCPSDWPTLLADGKTMIVLVIDDQPINGWVVIDHVEGPTVVPINTSTLEACADGVNIPDLDADGIDMSDVGAQLAIAKLGGFGFTVESTPCGKLSQDLYQASDVRTVLEALNALMEATGGPEWRIRVQFADITRRRIVKVIEFRPRIGMDRPDAIFNLDTNGRGSIETYQRTHSYAKGKGATVLTGTASSSTSAASATTDPIVSALVDQGWPPWEDRVDFPDLDASLDASTDEDTELDKRTRGVLAQREYGTVTWEITGNSNAPRPGIDYAHGDTIHIDVAPQGKRDPVGGKAAMRVIGYSLDVTTGRGTPLAWDDDSAGTG